MLELGSISQGFLTPLRYEMIRYSQVSNINTLKTLTKLCNQYTLLREGGASYITYNTRR